MNNKELAQIVANAVAQTDKQRALTVSTMITPFGCCNFFDPCSDSIFSLHYSGRLPLLDWMGFNVTEDCYRSLEFITFVTPAGSTVGYLADACADPNGIEIGAEKLTVEDFGRVGRSAPVREIVKPKNYCKTRPIMRLDGTPVTNEDEWDMKFAMDQILTDMAQLMIVGDASTGGQFDGLENWVATTYGPMLDSTIIDWNSNPMSGGTGITWNTGAVTDNAFTLIEILLEAFRRIRQRASWSPLLRAQSPQLGDFILVLPTSLTNCLLDYFTCWSICPGAQYNETNMNTLEARTFRNDLNGGMFGNGKIYLDGIEIPLMAYDWELIKGAGIYDMYFLTGSYGAMRIWEGEHLNAARAAAENGDQGIASTDGGRVLIRKDSENLCKILKAWIHPRLFCSAPWMQVRIQNIACDTAAGDISPDPTSAYYPDQTQTATPCP